MSEQTVLTIRQIRARAKKLLNAAGISYATSHPSRIRGWKNWTRGATIDESGNALATITARYDISSERVKDLAQAVAVLRAAGWTVEDNGDIMAVPHV